MVDGTPEDVSTLPAVDLTNVKWTADITPQEYATRLHGAWRKSEYTIPPERIAQELNLFYFCDEPVASQVIDLMYKLRIEEP